MAKLYYNAGAFGRNYSGLRINRAISTGNIVFEVLREPVTLRGGSSPTSVILNDDQAADLYRTLGEFLATREAPPKTEPMIEGEL